ncbi:hypothetical protein GCM10025874_13570 [Arenivirga flava]|uniref:Uncharacterized protein n=1 Tax=Arenivirga flava TaxID=1930060 RepID=A0AA37UCM3_9MICO|nr:hypothetical protein GCM10025874_13570 [Arenivirga flava]
MRGRAAVPRDECEHLVEVEQRGVGRGEVGGDQDERGVALGDAGRRHAAQAGDDALRDVAEVGRALGHVAAHADEQIGERREGLVHGALARTAAVDATIRVIDERRVLGHERLGVEHVLGFSASLGAAFGQVGGDRGERLGDAGLLGGDIAVEAGLLRFGEGFGHTKNGADRDCTADAHTGE